MSQYELLDDDNEPYLLYSIRESSLYFISDLVTHYFLQTEDNDLELNSIEDIISCPWFLNSYKTDPTIASMVSAITTIEDKLHDKTLNVLEELGDYISGVKIGKPHIDFLYYDMKNRHNGEETFVVINTTGEPLTANQNLKPVIIEYNRNTVDNIEEKWEEMETWFWQHRDKSEKTHTSDEGMAEFLRCTRLFYSESANEYVGSVENKDKFPYESISFEKIYSLFQVYKRIYDVDFSERHDSQVYYNNKNNHGRYSAVQLYSLLPTLKYVMRFDVDDTDIKRIYHIFSSIAKYQSVDNTKNKEGKTDVPVMRALAIIDDMTGKDVLCLKDSSKLNEQESAKLSFVSANLPNRDLAEKKLLEAEDIILFNRRIKTIIDWTDNDINRLDFYSKRIKEFWHGHLNSDIDPLRRALLTCKWECYPIPVENKTHKTLGWEMDEWYKFFVKNDNLVKDFLDSELSIEDRIQQFDDISSPFYSIIKDESYLQSSNWKNLNDYGNIIILMEKERAQANYCIFMNGVPYPKQELGGGWKTPWRWGNLLFCDHTHYDLTIDYIYDENCGYRILLWSGKYKSRIPFKHLSEAKQFGLESCKKGTEGLMSNFIKDAYEAKQLTITIAKWVDSVNNE